MKILPVRIGVSGLVFVVCRTVLSLWVVVPVRWVRLSYRSFLS